MTTQVSDADEMLQELVEAGVMPTDEENEAIREVESPIPGASVGVEETPRITPGTQVIHRGNDDFPAPVTAHLEEAGWIYVYYAIKTSHLYGDRSIVNLNMLPAQLRKRDPDTGLRAFTTRDPGVRPPQGTLICWLHADHEMRPVTKSFGFATCRKSNITSVYEAEQHTKRKHSREYAALIDQRDRLERAEDRELQREILRNMTGRDTPTQSVTAPPLSGEVIEAIKADVQETLSEPQWDIESGQPQDLPITKKCRKCTFVAAAENAGKAFSLLRAHHKEAHTKT